MLLAKVRSWAAASNGWFPLQEQNEHGCTVTSVAKYDGSDFFKWGKVRFLRLRALHVMFSPESGNIICIEL
jgi:hypothetical protein